MNINNRNTVSQKKTFQEKNFLIRSKLQKIRGYAVRRFFAEGQYVRFRNPVILTAGFGKAHIFLGFKFPEDHGGFYKGSLSLMLDKIVAVSDVFEESARKAAEICGAKVYADSKELINAENVDAVFIVSPGFAHVDSLLQAIEAGKRIFCEKPLCTTAEDCLKVVKAEEAAGKHLIQLGFMRRYDKGYQQIKEALATGEYGEPLILHCTHRNPEVGTNYNTPMAVHDTAIHEIDVLHWLVDDEYESAQVVMPKVTKYSHSELKDPQIMMLRTKKGVCIDVEVFVNCKFGYDINCEVVCEDGALKMAQPAYPSIRKNAAVSTAIDTDCFVRFKDAYDKEVQDWVDNAEAGVITGPNAWDGYLAAITADALVKAQETGQIEKIVSAVEKPEFYK